MRYRARVRDLEARLAAVEELARITSIEAGALQNGLVTAFRAAGMEAPDGPGEQERHLRLVGLPGRSSP